MESYRDLDDAQLLTLLAKGDEGAFRAIYDDHWAAIYKVGYKIAGTREAAEDCAQQVFMSLWDRRAILQINGHLKAYLATAVKYTALSLRLQQKNRASILAALPDAVESVAGGDQKLDDKILTAFLAETIDNLPKTTKLIFQYSREAHLSNRQIAERLDISVKTVEAHITKALKTIRRSLVHIRMWLLLM